MLKLEIKNFKSIKDLEIELKPLTILTGKPDTGKSNIIEAIGLFSSIIYGDYFTRYFRTDKILGLTYMYSKDRIFIRILRKVFSPISAEEPLLGLDLKPVSENRAYVTTFSRKLLRTLDLELLILPDKAIYDLSGRSGEETLWPLFTKFRFYRFLGREELPIEFTYPDFSRDLIDKLLMPASGVNLVTLIENNDYVYEVFTDIIRDLEYDNVTIASTPLGKVLYLVKKKGRTSLLIPFNSLANGLRNYVMSIIALNTKLPSELSSKLPEVPEILTFEEPESHVFPYFTKLLAEEIAHKVQHENFYVMLTTHNPITLTTLLEKCPHDKIALYWVYRDEDFSTRCVELTSDDIKELLEHSYSSFFIIEDLAKRRLEEIKREEKA